MIGVNAYGTNETIPATLTVRPWSSAQIQWSGPFSIIGQTADQILTSLSGNYVEAACFFRWLLGACAGRRPAICFSFRWRFSIHWQSTIYEGRISPTPFMEAALFGTNSTGDAGLDSVLKPVL